MIRLRFARLSLVATLLVAMMGSALSVSANSGDGGGTTTIENPTVDIVFDVDLSGSFGDDVVTFRNEVAPIANAILAEFPDTQFALTSYVDYPVSPFGSASSGDYAYQLEQQLTSDVPTLDAAVQALVTLNGNDFPESQLPSVYQAVTGNGWDGGDGSLGSAPDGDFDDATDMVPGTGVAFRDCSLRIIILWTDAAFHDADTEANYPGPGFMETVDALANSPAPGCPAPLVVGISSGFGGVADLTNLAAATGAVIPEGTDPISCAETTLNPGDAAVCRIASNGDGIDEAILALIGTAVDIVIEDDGLCNGLEPTIYVNEEGVIVGGPDDGQLYTGTLRGTNFKDVILGTDGDDIIRASNNDDTVCGEAGDDQIFGEAGYDNLFGGPGNDFIDGSTGLDFICGDGGDDNILGGHGADEIQGNAGNDTINAGEGDDVVTGNAGDDVIQLGGGQDFADGGAGMDEISGGNGDDVIYGDGESDEGAADILDGGTGQDDIFGGAGDDVIDGGQGDDEIFGGDGNDTINAGGEQDVVYGDAGNDEINGGNGDDDLFGGDGMDTIRGGNNNDDLFGGDGDDFLFGQNGDDALDGGVGMDSCVAAPGNQETIVNCEA